MARNFFTPRAKTKKFSHHVFWRYKQENFGAQTKRIRDDAFLFFIHVRRERSSCSLAICLSGIYHFQSVEIRIRSSRSGSEKHVKISGRYAK
ncbi:DUF1661 domain-containing protein [Porphyromonas sp. COT-052 OH4946]|uniref:DUF1661 domain-containing protein n=1 Tax=Porphyromonas sp. COT-052 OH4946 TaxID=1515618 RepID=UPI001F19D96A|nr:DUF1661 domain-containing protein [Porphyromonas sp. COT-052 OH4946]